MVYKQFSAVAIVILNWNGQKFLAQFLPSVVSHSAGCHLYVVDNQSTDLSVEFVQEHYPEVKIIKHAQNLGFCEGYNQALRLIKANYFVLLNSDVELTAGWLEPLLALMQSDLAIAACQPKIKSYTNKHYFEYAGAGGGLLDRLGYPFCRGRLFDYLEKDLGQYDNIVPVFWATGACMLVRASAYHQSGGLEPAFFAHMEEIDLCWRLQNLGYKIMYCGKSEVYHVGGGTLPASNPRKTYLNFRNGLALLYKNAPPNYFYAVLITRIILDWIAAFKFLLGGQPQDSWAVLRAHLAFFRNQNYWRQKRKEQKFSGDLILAGWYKGSIVWDYFIRRKKTFPALNPKKLSTTFS